MRKKIHLPLFICLLGFSINCQTNQVIDDSLNISETNQQIVKTDISDEEIRQLFIDSGLGEGDGKLQQLMALPKDRVVEVVKKLKDNGIASESESENIKTKCAYFLWELGVDSVTNAQFVADKAKSKNFAVKFDAIGYLGFIIDGGKKEYLPIVLKATPDAYNVYMLYVLWIITNELEKSPKILLQFLSKEPLKIRKGVYERVSYVKDIEELGGQGKFEKINSNVKEFTKDKELKNIAEEFLREINKQR